MELEQIKSLLGEKSNELSEQIKGLKSEFEQSLKDRASEESLKDLESKLHELANQQDAIQTELAKSKKSHGDSQSFKSQFMQNVWNEKNVKSLKDGNMINTEIALKTVSDMTTSYAATSGLRDIFAEIEQGITGAPKPAPTVLDYIRIGATNTEILKWVIKTAVEGGVGQTAEAAKFNQISYKWDKEQASAKKTTGYAKLSKDSIENLPFVQTETLDELVEDMLISVGQQVMTGDGTGENHKGVKEYAAAFARQTGIGQLSGVTEWDVLAHAALQVENAGKGKFRPNAVFISPKDRTSIKTIKDTTGQYVVPLYLSNSGMDIDGIPLVVDHNLTPGEFVLGDFQKFGWFNYRQMNVRTWEQNEDDVLKDFLTITASLRAVSRVKTPEAGAFVKGTFAAGITALEAAV